MELTALSDGDLVALMRDVQTETDRRHALAATPAEVARMTTVYVAGGGDRADLAAAVADAPDAEGVG